MKSQLKLKRHLKYTHALLIAEASVGMLAAAAIEISVREEEALSFGTTTAPPSSSYSTAKSHSVVLAGICAYTHAHSSYSSVWNGNSSQSSAFMVNICQKHPAEVLITAGQQSVNHYRESIAECCMTQPLAAL